MKAVGVKQLKARLSEYLRLVKSGETEITRASLPSKGWRGLGLPAGTAQQILDEIRAGN